MNWIVARLREGNSWRGIIWLATACGITLKPEIWEQITAIGMAVAGLIGVLTREEPKTVDIKLPPIELVGQALSATETIRSGTIDGTHSVAARHSHPEQLQRPVSPDYSPKQPNQPKDYADGWNG